MGENMTDLPKLESKVVHHLWDLSSDSVLRNYGDISPCD